MLGNATVGAAARRTENRRTREFHGKKENFTEFCCVAGEKERGEPGRGGKASRGEGAYRGNARALCWRSALLTSGTSHPVGARQGSIEKLFSRNDGTRDSLRESLKKSFLEMMEPVSIAVCMGEYEQEYIVYEMIEKME
jgi:hypothetical protein